ncbi:single-stranded DNA-binding protein [Pseudonocardia spirodelae]|uniref:Single-stranded DNA-binding protein n=1 Tax=Pseudonocardia spirodelae TaxID=3133431 RepID=A0ABU8T6M5_9PSEU
MSDTLTTIVGNLTRTPVLRYTTAGVPVADLTVAVNHRRKDPVTEQWRDVACTYYTVSCWRTLAEHAVTTFKKGHRVIAVGRLYVEEWTGRDGETRQSVRIEPSTVGLDIRFSPALVPVRPVVPSAREDGGGVDRAPEWGVPPTDEPADDYGVEPPDEKDAEELDELARMATAPASSG